MVRFLMMFVFAFCFIGCQSTTNEKTSGDRKLESAKADEESERKAALFDKALSEAMAELDAETDSIDIGQEIARLKTVLDVYQSKTDKTKDEVEFVAELKDSIELLEEASKFLESSKKFNAELEAIVSDFDDMSKLLNKALGSQYNRELKEEAEKELEKKPKPKK